jgi:hypothetical protein
MATKKETRRLVTDYNAVRARLLELYDELHTWRAVGASQGISGAMAFRIATEYYEPRDQDIRARLGLPALDLAPVCPKHGVVHVRKTCPADPAKHKRVDDLDPLKITDLESAFITFYRRLEIPDPLAEYHFSGSRAWRFDFAWPDLKLAVEIEGVFYKGAGRKSRHTTGAGYSDDCEKYNAAALDGWKVLRFTGSMLNDGRADQQLNAAFGKEIIK